MAKKLYEETNILAIANAIRSKNGTQNTYTTAEMPEAIEDIPSGGVLITKSITQNGTYDADDDNADGYSQVTVDVSGSGLDNALIPIMTSNLLPYGKATSSGHYVRSDYANRQAAGCQGEAFDAYGAFGNLFYNNYGAGNDGWGWIPSYNETNPFIEYCFVLPCNVNKIHIETKSDYTDQYVTAYILGQKSDGTYENCLLSGESITLNFKSSEPFKVHEFNLNGGLYKSIKICGNTTWRPEYGSTLVCLNNIQVYGSSNIVSNIVQYSKTAYVNGVVLPDPGYFFLEQVVVDTQQGVTSGISPPDSSIAGYETYVQFHYIGGIIVLFSVTGGYNGNAQINIYFGDTLMFSTRTVSGDAYNMHYMVEHYVATFDGNSYDILIDPPINRNSIENSRLILTVTALDAPETPSVSDTIYAMNGSSRTANTSYGYGSYSSTRRLSVPDYEVLKQIDSIFIKDNGIWKTVNDII